MAYDEIKPRGSTKASQPDAGGAVLRSVPLFGIVKDNLIQFAQADFKCTLVIWGVKTPMIVMLG